MDQIPSHHHCQSLFQLVCQVPPNTKKTVLDAVDGYHAKELDEESQPLTIFITEWGRYIYLRMPQRFLAVGDAYTHRYYEVIKDLPRKVKCVDDTLLYDSSIEESFYHTWDFLTLCAEKGIVINADKFQFCRDTATFAGLTKHQQVSLHQTTFSLPLKTSLHQKISLVHGPGSNL